MKGMTSCNVVVESQTWLVRLSEVYISCRCRGVVV